MHSYHQTLLKCALNKNCAVQPWFPRCKARVLPQSGGFPVARVWSGEEEGAASGAQEGLAHPRGLLRTGRGSVTWGLGAAPPGGSQAHSPHCTRSAHVVTALPRDPGLREGAPGPGTVVLTLFV